MKQHRLVFRIALLALLVVTGMFSSITGSRALAQATTSFVSPMTGISIDTSGPWTVDTSSVVTDSGIESVTVMGQYEFMQVWFMPGNTDLVQARDIVVDSFASTFESFHTIDRGAYGNVSYSLDMTSSEGIEFGVFSLFLGQRSSGYVEYYVYFGAVPVFASGFASAQQNVRVGGTPVFDGVDGNGLQNFLNQNAGATGASTQTGTTVAPPTPAPTQPAQTTAPTQPAEAPTQPAASTSAEGDAYLATIEAEMVAIEASQGDFLLNLFEALDGTPGAAEKVVEIVSYWESYPTTAAAITAPAGYETIHAEFQVLVGQVAGLAPDARSIVEALANGDQAAVTAATEAFGVTSAEVNAQIGVVRGLIADASTTTSTTTTTTTTTGGEVQPTQEPVATEASQTGTTAGTDGEAYVASVTAEIANLRASFTDFGAALELVASEDQADQDAGVAELDRILNYWGAYNDVAATIVAPAGFEDVDAAYRDVAGQVPALTLAFVEFLNAEDEATRTQALEDFNLQFTTVQDDIDALETLVGAGSSTETNTGTTTEAPTEPAQEEVIADPDVELDEDELDISETGSRGQIPRGDEEEPDSSSERSTRGSSSDEEALGLVAEDEYLSPQFDIEVFWDDRWEFDAELVDEPIGSDEENASDWITLAWLGGQGDITVTLGSDPEFDPEIMVSYWESEEYLSELPVEGEILLADTGRDRGAVLLLLDDGEAPLVLYREAVCLDRQCETFALVTIFTTPEDAEDIIADAEEGIDVGGDGATGVFSSRDIRQSLP